MKSIFAKLTLLGGLVLTCGCGSACGPRPLGVGTRVPDVEKRMVEHYDPFTDSSAGPDTDHRPREFSTQRSAPRRAVESQSPWVVPAQPGARPLPLGGQYPGVVRE